MKKIILSISALFLFGFANAQQKGGAVSKGKWLIEANTGFGENVGSTSFYFKTTDGKTAFNIGAEGGYFIKDKLAIKLGLGYGEDDANVSSDPIAYKIGVKYYLKGKFPVEVSYNGIGFGDADANPNYIGFQAGYAWFLGENVSIEPGIRYNNAIHSGYYDSNFQFNIGFALHF